jgi:hypothetical protein
MGLKLKEHDADMNVVSEVGQGTIFFIRWPIGNRPVSRRAGALSKVLN